MIEKILGGKSAEAVVLYMYAFDECYAREVSQFSGMALNTIQKQLEKFEDAGVLVSLKKGRTRMFLWNPRYPFLTEFLAFIEKVFLSLPEKEKERYFSIRKRPRKQGKAR